MRLARQFASNFIIITDATFNTNENKLPLSVLVAVTNTLQTIPIAYCYIRSESTAAFLFMMEQMKDLFFYGECPGPRVLMGDFAAGLTSAFTKNQTLTNQEEAMQVAYELDFELDTAGRECLLQLCNWHAVKQ